MMKRCVDYKVCPCWCLCLCMSLILDPLPAAKGFDSRGWQRSSGNESEYTGRRRKYS